MTRALDLGNISTRRRRIAEIARTYGDEALRTLAHFIDIHWLYEAWSRIRKNGAPGADEMRVEEYEGKLADNLDFLLERFKSGEYFAPPVRRVHIPKGKGKLRPIGIPTVEDKILQRAVQMALEPIYEQLFYDFSFGFRKGKSQHQALEYTWKTLMDFRGGWVLTVDVKGYFDTVDHKVLRRFLDKRVADGVIRRTIDKWLKAGILEDGSLRRSEAGTPQGGVISPLLANIYLHYVLDEWMVETVAPRLAGKVAVIRYADDFLIVFQHEKDARRVMEVIGKRFAKYGLTLHPEKTKLVDFRRPRPTKRNPKGGPGTLEFLGFTLHWGRSRRGNWVVRRKTAKSRLKASLKRVDGWLRANRSLKIRKQWELLCSKIRGHYQYYGVTGNIHSLARYLRQVKRRWLYWLRRRSQKSRMTWKRFTRILKHLPLPPPTIPKSVYRS